jgi:transposase-like protein
VESGRRVKIHSFSGINTDRNMKGVFTMGTNKRFSAQDKLNLLLSSFRKDKKNQEVYEKAGISSSVFHKWRKRLFSAALDALEDWNVGRKRKDFKSEREKELEQKLKEANERIDYLATELEVIKKKRKSMRLE